MKKICTYMNKNHWRSALFINAIVFLLVLCVAHVQYEVSDDFIMETIVSGLYNAKKIPYLPFSNMLLGVILQGCYTIYASINWYGVMMLMWGYLGFSGLYYSLMKRIGIESASYLQAIVLIFFIEDIYISIQFTKLAVFLIMVGTFIFLQSINDSNEKRATFLGGILVVVGTWYRFAGLYVSGLFVVFMILLTIWSNRKEGKEYIKRGVIYGGVLIFVILFAKGIDYEMRQRDEGMANYHEFNSIRASLSDFPNHGYERNEEWLREGGYSANDFLAATNWLYADTDYFTTEKLKMMNDRLILVREVQPIDLFWVKEKAYSREYRKYLAFMGCIAITILLLALNIRRLLHLIPCILVSAGLFAYFYKVNRIVYRVEFTIICSAFIYILYMLTDNLKATKYKHMMYAYLVLICVMKVNYIMEYLDELNSYDSYENQVLATYYDSWDNEPMRYYTRYTEKAYENLMAEINREQENYYYLDFGSTIQTLYLDKFFFSALEDNIYNNMTYLTGVTSEYPTVIAHLQNRDIENPIAHLLTEGVYYVSNVEWRDEILLKFIHEHYSEDIQMNLEKTIDGFGIYTFN